MKCCIKTCNKDHLNGGWIDVAWKDEKDGTDWNKLPFCKEHFEKVMSYLDKKEKEMQKKTPNRFWAFAPRDLVEEALNQ